MCPIVCGGVSSIVYDEVSSNVEGGDDETQRNWVLTHIPSFLECALPRCPISETILGQKQLSKKYDTNFRAEHDFSNQKIYH